MSCLPPLSFNTVGQPPTRSVYLTQVDPDEPGGLRVVETLKTASAEAYAFKAIDK